MYTLDNVDKSYGTVQVLIDVSCKIPDDGFAFIIGPSGAGKSTLLRLLSFTEVPDKGLVQLDLRGVGQFDSGKVDRPWPKVTTVFQKQFLWPHLTLRENINLPLRCAGVGDMEERLRSVIHLFDMRDFIDRFPNEVSGGEAQRAALARAFVLNPRLILIDEAHGGLDLAQQKTLNDHLLALRKAGVGLIVVSHSIEFARVYGDTIIVVENGRVIEVGPPTLLKHPRSEFVRKATGLS